MPEASQADRALRELARREQARRRIFRDKDLPYLISLMSAVDQRDGTRFTFEHIRDPLEQGEVTTVGNRLIARDNNWRWQRHVVDELLDKNRIMFLKGRQIGVTWIVLALDVAEAIVFPDTVSLLYRQRHDDAVDNVRRWWTLYRSLPKWITERVPDGSKTGPIVVNKPDKAARPGIDGVALQFADGSFSEIIPMSSAASSGHGRSVRHVMLDEAAHIENLASIGAAVAPAAGRARISIISTANGRSNPETGEGNEFHRRWMDEGSGYTRIFLPYDLHPDRDEHWYETSPEVQELRVWQRQEQFPRNELEAFALSDRSFFDKDALTAYEELVKEPIDRFDFVPVELRAARKERNPKGHIRVFAEPVPGHDYAIGADVATGRGADYSAAYVIDLSNMELAAELHGKIEADIYARDLHYLGRMYNTALIAIESTGGYGEAVIVSLRDGVVGRPPYPRLYRHILSARPDQPISKPFGFPTNQKTRMLIVNQIEQAIRERSLPWVTVELHQELSEFVHHDHGTSPRARIGSRDDRVMACAIALEMFRLYGHHPNRRKRRRAGAHTISRPWQRAA